MFIIVNNYDAEFEKKLTVLETLCQLMITLFFQPHSLYFVTMLLRGRKKLVRGSIYSTKVTTPVAEQGFVCGQVIFFK